MQKIVPNLWFAEGIEEAGAFYAGALPNTTWATTIHYPERDLPDFQREFAGQPLVVDVVIDGYHVSLINGGPIFPHSPAASLMLNFDSADPDASARLDATWAALSEGGSTVVPLGEYGFSPRYGWLRDRYGVTWQLILGSSPSFVVPQLMFCGPAQNRAREALDWWVEVFPESQVRQAMPYPEPTGPASAGATMYADASLSGQLVAVMDSRVAQDATFSPAFSLEVRCADQAEIDHFWAALSSVPEAEQCGWCVDRFGMSWQIVPANLDELMERPDAYAHLMAMHKIVIADF